MTKKKYYLFCPAYPPPFIGGSKVWTYNMVENSNLSFNIITSKLKNKENELDTNNNILRYNQIWDKNKLSPTHFDLAISYFFMTCLLIKLIITNFFDRKNLVIVCGAFTFMNGIIFFLSYIFRIKTIGLGNAEEFTVIIYGQGFKNFFKRIWLIFTHKKSNKFIVVCDYCKDILTNIGIKKNSITVIPSSININKISENKKNEVKNKLKDKDIDILSVGRLIERKGFHKLIMSIKNLKIKFPQIKLIIVGDGPDLNELIKLIKKNALDQNVEILINVNDQELSEFYKRTKIFALTSYLTDYGDTEGCPTVFSEASFYSLPLIGGTDSGASTIIKNGINGYVIDCKYIKNIEDKIELLLENSDLRKKLGKEANDRLLKYHTPEITGKQFRELINSI